MTDIVIPDDLPDLLTDDSLTSEEEEDEEKEDEEEQAKLRFINEANTWLTHTKHRKEEYDHLIKIFGLSPWLYVERVDRSGPKDDIWFDWMSEAGVSLLRDFRLDLVPMLSDAMLEVVELLEYAFKYISGHMSDNKTVSEVLTFCRLVNTNWPLHVMLDRASNTPLVKEWSDYVRDHRRLGDKHALLFTSWACYKYGQSIERLTRHNVDALQAHRKDCEAKDKKIQHVKEMGNQEYKEGRLKGAVRSYTNAIQESPYNHRLYGNRSQAYFGLQEYRSALGDAKRSLVLRPDWDKAMRRYLEALWKLEDHKRALDFVRCNQAHQPKDLQQWLRDHETKILLKLGEALTHAVGVINKEKEEKADREKIIQKRKQKTAVESKQAERQKQLKEKEERKREEQRRKEEEREKEEQMRLTREALKNHEEEQKKMEMEQAIKDYHEGIKEGSEAMMKSDAHNALKHYDRAMNVKDKFSLQKMKVPESEIILVRYCRGAAFLAIGTAEAIHDGLAEFSLVTEKQKTPLICMGIGRAYYALYRFSDAIPHFETGKSLTKKHKSSCTNIKWPHLKDVIEDTLPGRLMKLFDEFLRLCRYPPPPDATCRYDRCSGYKSVTIYFNDPEFLGFIRTHCYEACVIDYHPNCWKKYKSEGARKSTDKDMLNKKCTTPDCAATIIKISTYDSTGSVIREDVAPKVDKERIKKPVVKMKPSSIYTIQKRLEKKRHRQEAQATDRLRTKSSQEQKNKPDIDMEKPVTANSVSTDENQVAAPKFSPNSVTVLRKEITSDDAFQTKTTKQKTRKRKERTKVKLTLDEFVGNSAHQDDDGSLVPDWGITPDVQIGGAFGLDSFDEIKPGSSGQHDNEFPYLSRTSNTNSYLQGEMYYPTLDHDNPFSVPTEMTNHIKAYETIVRSETASVSSSNESSGSYSNNLSNHSLAGVSDHLPQEQATWTTNARGNLILKPNDSAGISAKMKDWSRIMDISDTRETASSEPSEDLDDLRSLSSGFTEDDTTDTISIPNDTEDAKTADIKESLFALFSNILGERGPCRTDDELLQSEINNLPDEARALIQKAGGLSKFLRQSLQFTSQDDFVCLMKDKKKAKEFAEEYKTKLKAKLFSKARTKGRRGKSSKTITASQSATVLTTDILTNKSIPAAKSCDGLSPADIHDSVSCDFGSNHGVNRKDIQKPSLADDVDSVQLNIPQNIQTKQSVNTDGIPSFSIGTPHRTVSDGELSKAYVQEQFKRQVQQSIQQSVTQTQGTIDSLPDIPTEKVKPVKSPVGVTTGPPPGFKDDADTLIGDVPAAAAMPDVMMGTASCWSPGQAKPLNRESSSSDDILLPSYIPLPDGTTGLTTSVSQSDTVSSANGNEDWCSGVSTWAPLSLPQESSSTLPPEGTTSRLASSGMSLPLSLSTPPESIEGSVEIASAEHHPNLGPIGGSRHVGLSQNSPKSKDVEENMDNRESPWKQMSGMDSPVFPTLDNSRKSSSLLGLLSNKDVDNDTTSRINKWDDDFVDDFSESIFKSLQQQYPEFARNPMWRASIMADIRKDVERSKLMQGDPWLSQSKVSSGNEEIAAARCQDAATQSDAVALDDKSLQTDLTGEFIINLIKERSSLYAHQQALGQKYAQLEQQRIAEQANLQTQCEESKAILKALQTQYTVVVKSHESQGAKWQLEYKQLEEENRNLRQKLAEAQAQEQEYEKKLSSIFEKQTQLENQLKDHWEGQGREQEEHRKRCEQLSQKVETQTYRAKQAELDLVKLKRDYGQQVLQKAILQAEKCLQHLTQQVTRHEEQGKANQQLQVVHDQWNSHTERLYSIKAQFLAEYKLQVERIQDGVPITSLPTLQVPRIPTPPLQIPPAMLNPPPPPAVTQPTAAAPVSAGVPASTGNDVGAGVRPPRNNFERIMEPLQKMFPNLQRTEIIHHIGKLRVQCKGSFSGMTMEEIIQRVAHLILQNSHGAQPVPVAPVSGRMFAEEKDPCIICYEELSTGDVIQLDCKHRFHDDCIRTWLQEQKTCPNCRMHVLLPDEFPALC